MPKSSLESRIDRLEEQMSQLLADTRGRRASQQPDSEQWKAVIGVFKKGDGMKAVLDEALKIREQHREEFYKKQTRRRTV